MGFSGHSHAPAPWSQKNMFVAVGQHQILAGVKVILPGAGASQSHVIRGELCYDRSA